MIKTKRPKIGLALGSGGARGLAHIGIIKVLEKNNIPIDFIAGSSMGAMIGGFYAMQKNIKALEKVALSTTWRQVFSILFDPSFKQGLVDGEKVEKFIKNNINGENFEDCKINFVAVATDLKTGKIVILDKGKIVPAIRASISIPLIFNPTKIDNKILLDGGLSAPVPAEIVKNMGADIVIAVNLDKHYYKKEQKLTWYNIANSSLDILRYHLAHLSAKGADIVIEIGFGKEEYWYKFTNRRRKILKGEKAMETKMSQLQNLIYQKSI